MTDRRALDEGIYQALPPWGLHFADLLDRSVNGVRLWSLPRCDVEESVYRLEKAGRVRLKRHKRGVGLMFIEPLEGKPGG